MKRIFLLSIIFFSFLQLLTAQDDYVVKRLNINSKSEDYSPQIWNNYLIFSSTRQVRMLRVNRTESKSKSQISNIVKSQIYGDTAYSSPSVFSKNLLSNHSDGPASFTSDGSKIYYARPIDISKTNKFKEVSESPSGIFSAEYIDEKWVNIKGLPFNSTDFIISQPAIAPDESFIVFSSNMPGYGLGDLFVSYHVDGNWTEPVNLGNKINTEKSELYPFIHFNGDLYFSSNGLNSKDDFDLYKCNFNGVDWDKPVALPTPLNSEFNEISFFLNYSQNKGYFASERNGVLDIYYFEKLNIDDFKCSPLVQESYCFELPELNQSLIEGLPLKYEFLLNGQQVISLNDDSYCFPSVGKYRISINIVDTVSGNIVYTQDRFEFLINKARQPFIASADSIALNTWSDFDAKETNLPGIELDKYLWDFGDHSIEKGETVRHNYKTPGNYKVTLTITGKSIAGESPKFCTFKHIEVIADTELLNSAIVVAKNPLEATGFIRLPDYTPLPDNLYYKNLAKRNNEIKMIHLLKSDEYISLSDIRFSKIDTSLIHVFQDKDNNFNYYFGVAFSIKEAYGNYITAREAGFGQSKIRNLKNAKLNSDEYYIEALDDQNIGFAVVLKKSKFPIENFEQELSEISALDIDIEEIYVPNEGYYYIAGNEKDINEAMSIYQELVLNGVKSVRIRDFSLKSVVASLSKKAEGITSNKFMIEIYRSDDKLNVNDSIFYKLGNRKVVAIRQNNREIAYFIDGGDNLVAAQYTLDEVRKKGFLFSHITNFKYERLKNQGYFISEHKYGDFSYVISFESSEIPIDIKNRLGKTLMGYKVYESFDPNTKKYTYKVDVGRELAESVMLANDMRNDSLHIIGISKLEYNPTTDDEFYSSAIRDDESQLVVLLGTYTEKQNIYKTFSSINNFRNILEIYDAQKGSYTYIMGGFEKLENAYSSLLEVKKSGVEDVYIRKFVYDKNADNHFYLDNVNQEIELYRITLARDTAEISGGDSRFDPVRNNGEVISAFDSENGDFVVAVGKSNDLPQALNKLGAVLNDGFESPKVEKYIYSSLDKDRFAILDLNKADRFYAVEIIRSDTLIPMESKYMRDIARKYQIISKYDQIEKKYVYLIGDFKTIEGANKYHKYAKKDGFKNAKVVAITFKTLAHNNFTIEDTSDENAIYVVNLLKTKNRVAIDNEYFSNIPSQYKVEEVFDSKTGFYSYLIKNAETIHDANKILARVKLAGYLTAHVDKMVYTTLAADEFTLESISDEKDDFIITLIRSKEKLGVDNPIFDKIRGQGTISEYYDYQTKEYIYSFGKSESMLSAYEQLKIAQENGFENSKIQKFVYDELDADYFYLETIEQDETMFTIVLAESTERLDKEKFEVFEDMGYIVREKFIESKGVWIYSLSLTDNIAEAEKLTSTAKSAGFKDARLNRFIYTRLSGDDYFLEAIDDDEELFMIVLTESKVRKDIENDPLFDNLDGRYKIEEIYDENSGIYKYYISKPIKDYSYAYALKKELLAMGYSGVRIIQFIYSTLSFDEYYIEYEEMPGDIDFVLKGIDKAEQLTVYFDFDQYFLDKKNKDKLEYWASSFNNNEHILVVLEGHADNIGDSVYNLWLSQMRARSVKNYLVNLGFNASNLSIDAKGEADPIVPNTDMQNRRLNRSVLLIISE